MCLKSCQALFSFFLKKFIGADEDAYGDAHGVRERVVTQDGGGGDERAFGRHSEPAASVPELGYRSR